MADLRGVCGSVTQSGKITSNGNFTCQLQDQGGQIVYVIGYNDSMSQSGPIPLVSLTSQDPTLSFTINTYSSGFRLFVWQDDNGTPTPAESSFDFIVAKMQ